VGPALHREAVDVVALVRELEAALRKRASDHPVELTVDEPMVADADRAQLTTALEILISTAWDLTRARRVGHVHVGALVGPDGRAYFVRDDGLGSAAADDPDLAEVVDVVRAHGGRLWTEAAPGAGATIYFTLGE
jgi:signal transduction histidine kinase